MNKDLFVETLDAMKKQRCHDKKCSEAFSVILPNDYVSSYDNHLLGGQLLKILQIETGDNNCHSWIEYFIDELDFGAKQTSDFCATDGDGKMIDLSTPGKLWEFLILQKL